MTNETPNPYVEPAVPADTTAYRGSVLASAVGVFLGGYILVNSLAGQLPTALAGFGGGPDLVPFFLSQLLFALAAVVFSLFLAPAPVSLKVIGSVIVVAGSIIMIAVQTARVTSGFGGIPASMTLGNPYFMTALTVGAAWLIVRQARVGWLALLAVAVLIPLPFMFAMGGVPFSVTQPVLLLALGVVGVVVLLAGRPRATR